MKTEIIHGITYSHPKVTLLHATPLWTAEVAGRTAYNSFSKSEHGGIVNWDGESVIEDIESSKILDSLAWVHFHHSVLELLTLTFSIKGTSRGVLMEHSRHRHQSLTVKSTRYTMQNILHAFNSCSISLLSSAKYAFTELILPMNMFVVQGQAQVIEIHNLYDKLHHQRKTLGSSEFGNLSLSKQAKKVFADRYTQHQTPKELYDKLIECPSKRNVGDFVKWVVTDTWKVDLIVTFNLRSLKNYYDLRRSGAAYFGIRHLAQAMKAATPNKYLDLIIKDNK